MIISLLYIALFYVFGFATSIIGFPILFSLFPHLEDRGYAFSRLFIFLATSFLIWFFSITFQIPYMFLTILLFFLVLVCCSLVAFKKRGADIQQFVHKNIKLILIEELIFLLAFFFFIFVRFGNPDLWHPVMGGEKPMDLAFTNAMVRTTSLPPYDPWFAGENINYYYFGQFITATFIKLLSIPTSYFYNIFLSYLFSQTILATFSLLLTLTNSKRGGLLGSFLLLGVGNLAQVSVILKSFTSPPPINGWYWTATRIMPHYEINEFPYFTFLYADLHSHLISLPITILFITLMFGIIKSKQFKLSIITAIISGLVLAILRMTNIWDFPTFALVAFVALVYKIFITKQTKLVNRVYQSALLLIILALVSIFASLPFTINYQTGPLGLSFFQGPYTQITDYLLIHGLFLFIGGSFIIYSLFNFSIKKVPRIKRTFILLAFMPLLLSIYFLNIFLIFLSLVIFLSVLATFTEKITSAQKLILFVFAFGLFLSAIPDVIDIKLGLGRMNTVFKFYYQSWIFLAISSAFFVHQLLFRIKMKRLFFVSWVIALVILIICAFSYVPTATVAKMIDRMSPNNHLTLDGEEYMRNSIYIDNGENIPLVYDWEAIAWIENNIHKPGVVLEATTPIYRWGSRISVYTGLPTVLGWDWHETAHRQYLHPEQIQKRAQEIKIIYESNDANQTLSFLNYYHVQYVVIGALEKVYYNTHGIEQIMSNNTHFKLLYSNPQTKIYQYID